MPSSNLAYNEVDISADTGAQPLVAADDPAPAVDEVINMSRFQVRIKAHTTDPAGQFLVTVGWFDGQIAQAFNAAFSPVGASDYVDSSVQEAWHDRSQDMTIQVQPLVAGGSVDVQVLFGHD